MAIATKKTAGIGSRWQGIDRILALALTGVTVVRGAFLKKHAHTTLVGVALLGGRVLHAGRCTVAVAEHISASEATRTALVGVGIALCRCWWGRGVEYTRGVTIRGAQQVFADIPGRTTNICVGVARGLRIVIATSQGLLSLDISAFEQQVIFVR